MPPWMHLPCKYNLMIEDRARSLQLFCWVCLSYEGNSECKIVRIAFISYGHVILGSCERLINSLFLFKSSHAYSSWCLVDVCVLVPIFSDLEIGLGWVQMSVVSFVSFIIFRNRPVNVDFFLQNRRCFQSFGWY